MENYFVEAKSRKELRMLATMVRKKLGFCLFPKHRPEHTYYFFKVSIQRWSLWS